MKRLMLLCCIVTAYAVNGQVKQNLTNPWGVWGIGNATSIQKLLEFKQIFRIEGYHVYYKWSELEPVKGEYDWLEFEATLRRVAEAGLWIGLQIQVGQNSPDWIYENVPEVITSGGSDNGPYPYYFDKDYENAYFKLLKDVADHLNNLPVDIKSHFMYWQITEGSTGDEQPYKGDPIDSQYAIEYYDWQDFRHRCWDSAATYAGKYRLFRFLFNSGNQSQDLQYVEAKFPGDFQKSGWLSHKYSFDGETFYYTRQLRKLESDFYKYRSRGEVQGVYNYSWWRQAPVKQAFILACSALSGGLDMLNIGGDYIESIQDTRPTDFFKKYAALRKATAQGANRGFIALRDIPDFIDTIRFPVEQYGPVINPLTQKQFENRIETIWENEKDSLTHKFWQTIQAVENNLNPARRNMIINEFEPAGAMYNITDDSYHNDFGLALTKNYARFIRQVSPDSTSIGAWRIGADSSMYGRYARLCRLNENNEGEMFFGFNDSLLEDNEKVDVELSIIYYDIGNGSWSVRGSDTSFTVQNGNTQEWTQKVVNIKNFKERTLFNNQADFSIRYESGTNTPFALIEAKLDPQPSLISTTDVSENEGDTGTVTFNFTVSLDVPSPDTVKVKYKTVDMTATAPSDYTAISDTLVTFIPGEVSKTIKVTINGDTDIEDEEKFKVKLFNPENAVMADSLGHGTIKNDDKSAISITNVGKNEGDTGTVKFSFTVSLDVSSPDTVTVEYKTVDMTATAPSDYTAISDTLVTFIPGEVSKTIKVTVNGDTDIEDEEKFKVRLSSPVNAVMADSIGQGTIKNDDEPAISITSVSKNEGNSGTVTFNFTISLDTASPDTVKVKYKTADNTATAPSDYTAISNTLLEFIPGEVSKSIEVTVNGDTDIEDEEKFKVKLSSPVNAVMADSIGQGTIKNDDEPPVIPAISITSLSKNEGNSGTVTFNFTVSLDVASPDTVKVKYKTADNTATAPSDYTAISNTLLEFIPGEVSKSIEVTVNGDTDIEDEEKFKVKLSGPVNAVMADSIGQGTIKNDDEPPVIPAISITSLSKNEGNSGTVTFNFTVSLDVASPDTVKVKYKTADNTATAPSDYTAISSTLLEFNPGEVSKSIEVTVNGDTDIEDEEKFKVKLSGPVNAVMADSIGQGTIKNDDEPAFTTIRESSLTPNKKISYGRINVCPNPAANPGLKLYPNPNKGQFTVELTAPEKGIYSFTIVDIAGRAMLSGRKPARAGNNRWSFSSPKFKKGVYVIHVQTSKGPITRIFIVE